ncbi:hypothetical protein Y699_03635 [Aspergillus fumigatus Z5]|nr:hypothetical protein Y699_03635 [Aspergillus fumigatus Z5]
MASYEPRPESPQRGRIPEPRSPSPSQTSSVKGVSLEEGREKDKATYLGPRLTEIQALHDIPPKTQPRYLPPRLKGLENRDIAFISLAACSAYAWRNAQMFIITLEDLKAALRIEKAQKEDFTNLLPKEFKDYANIFSPKEAERLPPHRPYDHDIKLLEGKTPPFGPLYAMSREELEVLKE